MPPTEDCEGEACHASYPENLADVRSSRLRDRGVNRWFDPVPLEMLFTPAQAPQVLVKVDGLEAVCPAGNCGYTYVAPVGGLTGASLSGSTLTVDGTELDHVQECVTNGDLAFSCEALATFEDARDCCDAKETFNEVQLCMHNYYRNQHLSTPALAYDPVLAADAQEWSQHLLENGGSLVHAQGTGQGENLAKNTDLNALRSWSIVAWYDELADYNYAEPGFTPETGHFTQVVW